MKIDIKEIKKLELKEDEILVIEYDPMTVSQLDLIRLKEVLRGFNMKGQFLIVPSGRFDMKKIKKKK